MTFQLTTLGQSTFELGMFLTYGVLTTDVWTNDDLSFDDLTGDALTNDISSDKFWVFWHLDLSYRLMKDGSILGIKERTERMLSYVSIGI